MAIRDAIGARFIVRVVPGDKGQELRTLWYGIEDGRVCPDCTATAKATARAETLCARHFELHKLTMRGWNKWRRRRDKRERAAEHEAEAAAGAVDGVTS